MDTTWTTDEFGNRSWTDGTWDVRIRGGSDLVLVTCTNSDWDLEVDTIAGSISVTGSSTDGYNWHAVPVVIPFAVLDAVREAVSFVKSSTRKG